ncbi:hypothetical protein [Agrobacterium sp.]|uniref:hypothetical protein n=1 Tax=Agrobacterium sp. TaxID=361 RepID=UPI00289CB90A|nr:hypothetical protein [Agrobacterium sp.]
MFAPTGSRLSNPEHRHAAPEAVERIINSAFYYMHEHADTETKQPFINIVRQFIQKVVIGKTPGHQPAALEVHGRIASILAAMEAATILEKQFEALKQHDYLEKLRAGELDTEQKQKKLLDAYAEQLSLKRLEWQKYSSLSGCGGARSQRFLLLIQRHIPKLVT